MRYSTTLKDRPALGGCKDPIFTRLFAKKIVCMWTDEQTRGSKNPYTPLAEGCHPQGNGWKCPGHTPLLGVSKSSVPVCASSGKTR